MKTTAALGQTTRTVGKVFLALILLFAAVVVGFGGTALFVYHQFGDIRRPTVPVRTAEAERRTPVQPLQNAAEQGSSLRPVANGPADRSSYTYADNKGGQPSVPGGRTRPADAVPAALDPSTQTDKGPVQLSDPESRYIVDQHTGRVIGIDGSAGARREAEQANFEQPPQAVAVQTPPPEVRVASPVMADGMPVYQETTVAPASAAGSQYVPIRRALPVNASAGTDARTFSAREYMANDEDRPVLRAQAVVPPGARVERTLRVYRLPDGSQTVAAY